MMQRNDEQGHRSRKLIQRVPQPRDLLVVQEAYSVLSNRPRFAESTGAILSIGEKFTVNPATGSGGLSIPLPLSHGRAGFTPDLTLAYDSSSGNGVFGFGWTASTAAITRKTDRGLPRYRDSEESDIFVLSGAVIVYHYRRDDDAGVDVSRLREAQRSFR
jgi:hypothetical protein